jgi:SPP1 gp7 family putative phage head morphogenesis protein
VFTVAGATSAAMAGEIQASLVKALEEGKTLSQFRKDFDQVVQRHGWTYNGKRGWRSALIFNTNMRSATMAGRWAQIQQNKANRPYLQYRTAGDARVRPEHRMWNGIIRHVDDVFWSTHYPPNGWNCRCTVRAYAQWEIDDKGLTVETTPHKTVYRDVANKDGLTDRVPVGVDPGWDHNVGMSWIAPEINLGNKLATLPLQLRGQMVNKTISPAFQTVISDNWKSFRTTFKATEKPMPKGRHQIVGFLDSAILDAVATNVPSLQLESTAVVAFDNEIGHLEGGHKAPPPDGAPRTRNHKSGKQVWPEDWVDALPIELRSYKAVLWDAKGRALVLIPQGQFNDTVPKIAIKLNHKTKLGYTCRVASLGSAVLGNLRSMQLLLGKLPEAKK